MAVDPGTRSVKPTTRALRCGVVGGLSSVLLLAACQASPPQGSVAPSDTTAAAQTGSTPAATQKAAQKATPSSSATTAPKAQTAGGQAELPRGGRVLFPKYRLVGYAGTPGSPALGRLGIGKLDDRIRELDSRAAAYAGGRTSQPVLELLTTIVQGSPGRDGMWRSRLSDSVIRTYLEAARRHRAILLLGIQPGRSTFLSEVKAYEKWLGEPDVGLALDPEWAMQPGQVPMKTFGHTTGPEINNVSAWVASLVQRRRLPQKPLVVHELAPDIIRDEAKIRPHPGVALIKSVDGIGTRAMKEATWRKLTTKLPKGLRTGFKLFYEEDRVQGPLMTPRQVLALKPQPEYVVFE